jgi:hypothetical protein
MKYSVGLAGINAQAQARNSKFHFSAKRRFCCCKARIKK